LLFVTLEAARLDNAAATGAPDAIRREGMASDRLYDREEHSVAADQTNPITVFVRHDAQARHQLK